ncbi:hypothetical protein, partial [Symbiopectobacterium sp.]|uniref:hypothetical protein n=1 Tax=Symbiopectobacterium sp. TaxID=2952789 RepID=UPI003F6887EB
MEPLVAYWKQRDDRIFSVLYTSDGYENILKSIDKIYLRKMNATRVRGRMTEKEVSVLFLVLDGCSLKEIAGELQIGSKRLYNRHSAPTLRINSTVSLAENINDGLVNRIEVGYLWWSVTNTE